MSGTFRVPIRGGALLTLKQGRRELVLAPECGARIVAFRCDGRDVLRPASAETLEGGYVYGFAGFPLMPYSGPIFGGGFPFAGQWHPLARTVREEPTATHGEGWIRPWTVQSQAGDRAVLSLDHRPEPGTFPFAWRGRLDFALGPDGLVIDLEVVCRDHRPMPAGIGFRPISRSPRARACSSTRPACGRRMRRRPSTCPAARLSPGSTSAPARMLPPSSSTVASRAGTAEPR
jgi:hypothetical protein